MNKHSVVEIKLQANNRCLSPACSSVVVSGTACCSGNRSIASIQTVTAVDVGAAIASKFSTGLRTLGGCYQVHTIFDGTFSEV